MTLSLFRRVCVCSALFYSALFATDASIDTQVPKEPLPAIPLADSGVAALLAYADGIASREDGSGSETDLAAQCFEALAIIEAGRLLDYTKWDRLSVLVAEIRGDARIEGKRRFEVVSGFEHLSYLRKEQNSEAKDSNQTGLEALERGLVVEFPRVDDAYEGLLHFAENNPNSGKAELICQDLCAMLLAPQWVRNRSSAFIERRHLLGVSLREIFARYPESLTSDSFPASSPVVVYSWSSKDNFSLALSKRLQEYADRNGCRLIGVCLDSESEGLIGGFVPPGSLVRDPAGQEGQIATALFLTHTPLAYLSGADGTITSVSLAEELQGR